MQVGFPRQQALGPFQNHHLGMEWDAVFSAFLPCELPKDKKANLQFLEPLSLQAMVEYKKHIFNIWFFLSA